MDLGASRSEVRISAVDSMDTAPAHRISLRFQDGSSEISEDTSECRAEYVADYELICNDCGLSANQMLRSFLLREDAQRFYLSKLVHMVDTCDLVVPRLRDDYHSDVRQSQVRKELASLRMKAFEAKGMSVEKALLSNIITFNWRSGRRPARAAVAVLRVKYDQSMALIDL